MDTPLTAIMGTTNLPQLNALEEDEGRVRKNP
jgi:hypothetical protein